MYSGFKQQTFIILHFLWVRNSGVAYLGGSSLGYLEIKILAKIEII